MRSLITILCFALFSVNANACNCATKRPVPVAYASSLAVVKAKVLSMEYTSYALTMDPEKEVAIRRNLAGKDHYLRQFDSKIVNKVQVEVLKVYKGDSIADTLTIYTHRASGSCGYTHFQIGQSFIIYASGNGSDYGYFNLGKLEDLERKGTFWAYKCSRTDAYNLEEDQLLNKEMPYGVQVQAGRKG